MSPKLAAPVHPSALVAEVPPHPRPFCLVNPAALCIVLTERERDQVDAAALRDGYTDTEEWVRDLLVSIAGLT